MRPVIATLVLFGLLTPGTGAGQDAGDEERPTSMAHRSTVFAPRGVVATSQALASSAGLGVLERGGNAVDAAVTAAAVLNVVEPHMTGIGGDMFAILWLEEEGRLVGLDASGRSGSEMTAEAIRAAGFDEMPGGGPHAVTVPGALSGWAALLDRYGTLTLAESLRPAIRIAEEGFPVSPIIAGQWKGQEEKLREDAGARATYLVDGDRAPEPGEWVRNPDLASSFRTLARDGMGALYGGALGQRIVNRIQEMGGFLTLDDLRNHEPRWVDPISVDFRSYTVWELPPSGQGIAALEMLKILEPYELQAMGHNSAPYLHHLIEAKKLAYADLYRYVADVEHMEVTPDALLDPAYVRQRRELLDPNRAMERTEPGRAATASETIYLSAADRHGNMVSFINSIYSSFGSGVVVPGTGFALQNRGAGFTLEQGHANRVAPGKRPLHTIIPGFVTRNGEPWLSFGLMGGSMQPQGHVQMLLNLFLFDMDLQEAIDAARFRHFSRNRVGLEPPLGEDVRRTLESLGHEVLEIGGGATGGAQAVMKLERGWAAGSDPRKDGQASGH